MTNDSGYRADHWTRPEDTVRDVGSQTFDRRRFLRTSLYGLGVIGSGIAFTACSNDDQSFDTPGATLVALYNPARVIVAGRPQRIPFGLVDQGQPVTDTGESLSVDVMFDGELIETVVVEGRIVSHDHPDGAEGEPGHEHSDILRYFALRTTLPEVGIYDFVTTVDGEQVSLPVQAFDPEEAQVVLSGEPLPAVITPTVDDPLDVRPLCTLRPDPCAFHDRTAADVLEAGEPMALLIATPALCATSYCGPVLDVLIRTADEFPTVVPIHVEVYANAEDVDFNLLDPEITPVETLGELGLDFEPSLFLVDRDGIVVDRIDNVFDDLELREGLAKIA